MPRVPADGRADRGVELVAPRRRDPHFSSERGHRLRQRERDVVAVADIRNRPSAERSPLLTHGQAIGERLTRMFFVGECVYDAKTRSGGREGLDP